MRRTGFAVAVGALLAAFLSTIAFCLLAPAYRFAFRTLERALGRWSAEPVEAAIGVGLLIALPAGLIAAFATARILVTSPPLTDTLCRKCGYTLRGLSEPRCPECGEAI